MMNVVMEMSIE